MRCLGVIWLTLYSSGAFNLRAMALHVALLTCKEVTRAIPKVRQIGAKIQALQFGVTVFVSFCVRKQPVSFCFLNSEFFICYDCGVNENHYRDR
jgi:hypothetical protein